MDEQIIRQERSNKELVEYMNKCIEILTPLNMVERYKVVDALKDSLNELIKKQGIAILEKDEGEN